MGYIEGRGECLVSLSDIRQQFSVLSSQVVNTPSTGSQIKFNALFTFLQTPKITPNFYNRSPSLTLCTGKASEKIKSLDSCGIVLTRNERRLQKLHFLFRSEMYLNVNAVCLSVDLCFDLRSLRSGDLIDNQH